MMKKTVMTMMTVALAVMAVAQETPRPSPLLNRRTMPRMNRNRMAQQPSVAPNPASLASAAGGESAGGGATSDLNFNQTPLDLVFETYSRMVGKTILKDPQVPQATITLKSEAGQKLTEAEQIEAIEIVLEMNGVHLEPYGEKFIRALPRKDARKEGIPLIMDPETKLQESGKVVSMMIPFKNIAIDEAQKALEGFKSNSGILLVFERTNSILVTDTEQNINRMLEIARAIDIASPVTEVVEYIQIKYASANDVKQVLDSIVQESQKEQEKNGKAPTTTTPQNTAFNRPGLLGRRPGQQQNQPETVNNQSLVLSVSDADRGMIRGKVVTIADERSNKILIITSATNMKFFKDVIAALDVETTPDTVVKVYRLKYAEAEDVSDMINDLIGNSSSSKSSGKSNQNQNAAKGTSGSVTRNTQAAKKPANQRSGEVKAGELNKDNTTVLSDERINGIVVMTQKELVPTIEQIIESMDVKLSQVLIETCIIEVTLGDDLSTGMDWVQKGRKSGMIDHSTANGFSENRYYAYNADGSLSSQGYTSTEFSQMTDAAKSALGLATNLVLSTVYQKDATIIRDGLLNYTSGGAYGLAGGGSSGAAAYQASKAAMSSGVISNMFGKAFNFVFDSEELGITAIFNATKSDSRTKYIASPVIMTLDNKEAVINATAMRYLLKGFTSSGNSYSTIAVPDYEQKELGIEIKATPKINPNGTVMLEVEEKYTQLGANQTIQYSTGTGGDGALKDVPVPTTITREMSSDVILENNQTVVFAGLTDRTTAEAETGIPILKDIPWIGKWLFGSVEQTESRTELLVFMTPYVLDDAQAAQVEALRRKKTMSDPRPWEDNGWSLSPLADPVSKKEQMRRIKDEWKKQDEERNTRLEIEKAKLERAKKLEKMSEAERKQWLELHKEELDEEKQAELEEKMLDEKSQDALKKLAAEIRAKKLGEAEKALKKAEKEAADQNARAKALAEKAAEKDEEKAEEKAEESAEEPKAEKPAAEPKAEKPVEKPAAEPKAAEPKPVEKPAEKPSPKKADNDDDVNLALEQLMTTPKKAK